MADLDNFFAKKDKKKSRVNKTIVNIELGNRIQCEDIEAIPDQSKKVEEPKSRDETEEIESTSHMAETIQEEEWGEYEHEKRRDYTGLKIQKLQIQDEEEDEEDEEEYEEIDNDEGNAGPWNRSNIESSPVAYVNEAESVNVQKGVYIPPSRRSRSGVAAKKNEKKEVLDLSNHTYFPTLSAATVIEHHAFKVKKFELQEHGFIEQKPNRSHSNKIIPENEAPRLNLDNKFDALRHHNN